MSEPTSERDPFLPVEAPPRGRRALAVAGLVSAALALWTVAPILTGPLGMVLGLLSHVKGDRWGFPVAVAAGLATVIGMAVSFLFFGSGLD